MNTLERIGLSLLHRLPPESAHDLAHFALRAGFTATAGPVRSSILATDLAGMHLPNPVGLAAGFDKNARALKALSATGFGFLEAGAVTPRAQPGNPKPRLFRLREDQAIINRFGFNNDGMEVIAARLRARPHDIPVGINLGANKDSTDRVQDYVLLMQHLADLVDFATINISSPNTAALRELQGKEALHSLLAEVTNTRNTMRPDLPLFVKIAPDLTDAEVEDIAEAVETYGLSGIIATNTTLSREGLRSAHRGESGGLSGPPLTVRAEQVLSRLYQRLGERVALMGVGGIGSVEQAWRRIAAGATAIQLYTALVYQGLGLAAAIAKGLEQRAKAEGLTNISEIRGSLKF